MYRFLVFLILMVAVGSCGKEQGDILTLESEAGATETPYLVVAGQDGNHRGFAFYTLDGEYVFGGNFRAEVATPRGLTPFSPTSVLMSLDTSDSIYEVSVDGTKTLFHGSAQFNGNIYGIVAADNGRVYAVETNRIEVFDESGLRLGSALINTNVGACSLNNPRGMTINSDGNLVVVNAGGADAVLTYDISSDTATCLGSVALGNNPYGVLLHSDGFLYITTQGDDQVYRTDPDGSNPQVVWATNTSIINDPTGIVELPNGDLLVASSATDTVERITTSGVRVGTQPFIEDTQTLNLGDLTIIGDVTNAQ